MRFLKYIAIISFIFTINLIYTNFVYAYEVSENSEDADNAYDFSDVDVNDQQASEPDTDLLIDTSDLENSFTQEQARLNQTAAEATLSGDYQSAEVLFNIVLELGEFNVTWLNLGRTYAKAGKCLEAKDAYEHVLKAPKLHGSETMQIDEKLKRFQEELAKQCYDVFVAEEDRLIKLSKDLTLAGWPLLGVGVAGILTGIIMYAAGLPPEYHITSLDTTVEQEAVDKYNSQVTAAKAVPMSLGVISLLGGSALLMLNLVFTKKAHGMQEAREISPQEQPQIEMETIPENEFDFTEEQAFYWSPVILTDPSFNGMGIHFNY